MRFHSYSSIYLRIGRDARPPKQILMTNIPHDSIQYLEKKKFIHIWGKKLPHWFQEHKTVFVTFRLADSLPQEKIEELKELKRRMVLYESLSGNDEVHKEYNLEVARKIERWIDLGHGSCVLANQEIRRMVANAILFQNEDKYVVYAFVVMPNHVHILMSPLTNTTVVDIIGKIKSFTSKKINKALHTTGKVWQNGIFDRIVRDANNFEQYMNYIHNNPRNLPQNSYTLYLRE